MKKLMVTCICIIIVLVSVSCENTPVNTNKPEAVKADANMSTDSNNSVEEKVINDLKSRIEALEKEISSLDEVLNTKKQITNNHGAIINALDNMNGDNICVGVEQDGEYLTAVYVKIPNEIGISYNQFYLLTGYETDNVPILDRLIKPHHTNVYDKFAEFGVDKDKFEIVKLITSKIEYNETSSMLIIMINSNGDEYSDYISSLKFMTDI